jgi:glycosyltransferase involved in cell wall biosynthesis
MTSTPSSAGFAGQPAVSVIVPARNEEACLGACLESLVAQAGIAHEITVVDDGSTDRTRAIAESFAGVRVIEAGPRGEGWGGKANAVWTGAQQAKGKWLLFTDADTVHVRGSLAVAVAEAQSRGVSLLSYSPAQEVHGFWEHAVMPVVFGELATTYKPERVSDPGSKVAAANGQYLLVERGAYFAVGGHAAVAHNLLEDVELAREFKQTGKKIFFRYGGEAVKTRMYRSFRQLAEGWTKNLALLFPATLRLALLRLCEFAVIVASAAVAIFEATHGHGVAAAIMAMLAFLVYGSFEARIRKANFGELSNVLAFFGLPIFTLLLLRSHIHYKVRKSVTWKGREYAVKQPVEG